MIILLNLYIYKIDGKVMINPFVSLPPKPIILLKELP